ncbi:hypothetical protein L915_15013 [Phytophthora nicotianae]|uniref:Uncharacterized protein n=2 Tax=Phytophthora nicotianae TaxID=4792 RepID=W2G7R9_PHYNI|nr:hypothetical protein L915_15013 [Phytophthora nicotianae]
MATPEGPRLTRNPDNSGFDEREKSRNKRLQTSSNRLGARDLRVLRDNFTEMGGTSKTFSQKRPVQETPGTTAYVTAKRFNARQRMQEMEKRVTMNEDTQNAAGLEVANLTAYFREDANRRADAEEKRRREDLNERRETERKEREEREQTRREEENRRVQELAERRRQFDERMKLDRQEAGERHQQMMILLSAFMPKKQGSQKEDENSTHL